MKILLALLLSSVALAAQTTTNLVFRITVETVAAGVTNGVNTTLRLDSNNTDFDTFALAGLAQAYAANIVANGTNAPTYGIFLRTELKDQFVRQYKKAAEDKAKQSLAIERVPTIISDKWDLLTTAQRNQLAAIAAAFPNP